jgi:beta-glucosidase
VDLTLSQKVRLLTGADFWTLHPEPAAGLRPLVLSDGPAGVRGQLWDERDWSVNVPSPVALGATWSPEVVADIAALLADEAHRKGVDVLLAPTVNLHRTPYGGRHFECFSEDPLLTARLGVAYVRALQEAGVAATVKHFVANDSETERMTLDARVDERTLRELYLAPFEAIVTEAGVWALMAAYNGVNGHTMTESPMLRQILRDEWHYDGLVMSDWYATRSTGASAEAGLDLAMPGPHSPWGDALAEAVRAGAVAESTVDEKVNRIRQLAARTADRRTDRPYPGDDEVAERLRAAAAAGFVLLHNRDGALPLPGGATVAVVGPNAEVARTMGGGSATVMPRTTVAPLAGIRALFPGPSAIGVPPADRLPLARAPWLDGDVELRFLAADDRVLGSERRAAAHFQWMAPFGADVVAIEASYVLAATEAGRYTVGVSGVGRFRVSVAGEERFDGERELRPDADIVETFMIPPQQSCEIDLVEGDRVPVVVRRFLPPGAADLALGASFDLNIVPPYGSVEEELDKAVAAARDATAAVVVVGTNEQVESEGFDRTSLALPGRQDDLVRRVAAVNPRTVVVVNAGAPVLMPWTGEVAAVLLAWFPGQEFGSALADVLAGHREPGGRLPTSWPDTEEGLPSPRPVDGVLTYAEGLAVGYRDPARTGYPFGFGLGYTTWRYDELVAEPDGPGAAVTVRVTNTPGRAGGEVVQVYLRREDGAVSRPARWLAGWARAVAAAGETVTVRIAVPPRAFQHWDTDAHAWAVEPGAFTVEAGPAAGHAPLTGTLGIAG